MRWSPHPLTLRQLQYALAVAEHRSFRRAAAACRVAQPSLSAQVAQLEEALGVNLFERDRRRVLVTSAGAPLLERMRRIVAEADDLVDAAVRARDPFAGTMRIGVIPTVAPYLLPEVAPALRAAYPALSVVWVEDKTRVLRDLLATGEIDAAIVASESDLGDVELAPLGQDAFVLAAPAGHPLSKPKRLARMEELAAAKVLLLDDGHCFRDQALSLCQRVGADEASVRATSLSTLVQMVAGGDSVTLLPALAISIENRSGALSLRRFAPRAPYRTLALAFRRGSPIESALQHVAATLRDAYQRASIAPQR
ncbi:LysR substrate-binding domain-containing protein [Sorangium sp. So ce1078]|uniref:LysR substrate-binding domain-containing protein n=1 Tax=Sorangium sp. So ce1078 TaxID=3133329 RepID=UPI003F62F854